MKASTTKLLVQKLVIAFLVGFFSALVTSLEGLSKQPSFGLDKSVIISLIVGALAAGVRTVLAFGPFSLTPSDKAHSLIKRR